MAQIENLGFEARIDVGQAQGALGKLEASLRSLQAAFGRAPKASFPVPDAGAFSQAARQIEERLKATGQAAQTTANQLDKALATMATLTAQRTAAAAQGSRDQLDKLDTKIQQVQQRIRGFQAQGLTPSPTGGTFYAPAPHAGGGVRYAGPARGIAMAAPPAGLGRAAGAGALMAEGIGVAGAMAGTAAGSAMGAQAGTAFGAMAGSIVPGAGTVAGGALGGAISSMVGGLIGGAIAHRLVSYMSGAVARSSEEYIRETNLYTRDRSVRGASGGIQETVESTADTIQLLGRPDLFTREESRNAYEAMARAQGKVAGPDLLNTLNFTRAFGLSAPETAGQFGRMGLFASLGGNLSRQVAAGIVSSGMMERTEESLEATVSLLEDLGGRIGKLNDTQTSQLLAFQATLGATGNPLFQGQRGARVASGFLGAMADGATDETIDTLIAQGLMRYGSQVDPNFDPNKKTYFDMMQYRETNPVETAKAFQMLTSDLFGGDDTVVQLMLKKMNGWSATQTGAFYQNIFKPGNFGDASLIDATKGQKVIDAGREVQRTAFKDKDSPVGRAEMARLVETGGEDFDRKVGRAGFRAFKEIQDSFLRVGNNLMDFVNPAVVQFNGLLAQLGDHLKSRAPGETAGYTGKGGGVAGRVPPGTAAGRLYMTGGKGQVTSEAMAARRNPVTGKVTPHEGMDVGAAAGTPVYAADAGVVRFAGPAGDMGNMVVIDHDSGDMSRYGHLQEVLVAAGQVVGRGQVIGRVGSTGRSTGPHLHFEVRKKGGQALDQGGLDAWLQQHGGAAPSPAPAVPPTPRPTPAGSPRPGPAKTSARPGVDASLYAAAPGGGAAVGMQVSFSQNFQVNGGDPEQVRRAAREGAIEGYKQAATMLAGMTMGNA